MDFVVVAVEVGMQRGRREGRERETRQKQERVHVCPSALRSICLLCTKSHTSLKRVRKCKAKAKEKENYTMMPRLQGIRKWTNIPTPDRQK